MELTWKTGCNTTHIICLKLRSKTGKEIRKVSNLIANTFHFMLSNLPMREAAACGNFPNRFISGSIMIS